MPAFLHIPKSHNFTSPSLFINIFLPLISLSIKFLLCINFIPCKTLYIIEDISFSVISTSINFFVVLMLVPLSKFSEIYSLIDINEE